MHIPHHIYKEFKVQTDMESKVTAVLVVVRAGLRLLKCRTEFQALSAAWHAGYICN